jgi:KDO2-lipid IV(A) lauroyltransferase
VSEELDALVEPWKVGEARRIRREKRRWTTFRLARLAFALARELPLPVAVAIGAAIGRIAARLALPLRRDALRHLEIAFGDRLSPRDRRRLVSAMFTHLGRSVLEFAVYTRTGAACAVASVEEIAGHEHLEAAFARGRGVLLVTPHLGLWELLAVALLARHPGCAVGVRLHFGPADEMLTALRRGLGVETVHQSRTREILGRLRRGEAVGVLPDQDADHLAGFFHPFFGREAYTLSGPATLAWVSRCAVVPGFIHRTGPRRHRIEIREEIRIPRDRGREAWIRDTSVAISEALQAIIADHPEQWVWFHRRWATTPATLEERRRQRARREARRERRRQRRRARREAGP